MTQEANKVPTQSWWSTLPGILTAIGGVVGAITALVAALTSAGLLGQRVSNEAPNFASKSSEPRIPRQLPPQNSSFRIAIVVAGYSQSEFDTIKNELLSRGFDLNDNSAVWPTYERWMPPGPTVHYYDDANEDKAKGIASLLKQATGFDFKVARGKGLGYTEDEYPFVFTVHLNRGPR